MNAVKLIVQLIVTDNGKSGQKSKKNTANFCENRKNHGNITALNYGSKYHYKLYKIQHILTLTTISNVK